MKTKINLMGSVRNWLTLSALKLAIVLAPAGLLVAGTNPATITVNVSPNPWANQSQPLTVSVTVTGSAGPGTGAIELKIDNASSGTTVPLSGGGASFTVPSATYNIPAPNLGAGQHTIGVDYSGDSNYLPQASSSNSVSLTVSGPQLVLTPPCTVASLTGGFAYGVAGFTGKLGPAAQFGRLLFNGAGGFANTFSIDTNNIDVRLQVTNGTYTVSSDCSSATLIFHGNPTACVFMNVSFNTPSPNNSFTLGIMPLAPPLGSQSPAGPLGAPVVGPTVVTADGVLSCTDGDAEFIAGTNGYPPGTQTHNAGQLISTLIGFMNQQ